MATVELRRISKSFGPQHVLHDIDMSVEDGEFLTVVGPSGCGKSTLIRIIAGLEPQGSGSVRIGGTPVDNLRPYERNVAMVFQNYALYPHLTVFENIATPLIMTRLALRHRIPMLRALFRFRHRAMREIADEVRTVAAQLQIQELLDRRPTQLSVGQRQRVALGRAMVRHPAVFLMDEPLSSLDAELRAHMRTELMELHARLGTTFIYVTHDQTEAMTMSDRVAVMTGGRLLQLATPSVLYDRPKTRTVAEIIGDPRMNLFEGAVDGQGQVHVLGNKLPLHVDLAPGTRVTVGLRPESLIPGGTGEWIPGNGMLRAELHMRENLGSEQILHFRLSGHCLLTAVCRCARKHAERLREGEMALHFMAEDCHVFGPDGSRVSWRQRSLARREMTN